MSRRHRPARRADRGHAPARRAGRAYQAALYEAGLAPEAARDRHRALGGAPAEPRVRCFAQKQERDALICVVAAIERTRREAGRFVMGENRNRGVRGARIPAARFGVLVGCGIVARDLGRDTLEMAVMEAFERAGDPSVPRRALRERQRCVERGGDEVVRERVRVPETGSASGFPHDLALEQLIDRRQAARAARAGNAACDIDVEGVAADCRNGRDAQSLGGKSL